MKDPKGFTRHEMGNTNFRCLRHPRRRQSSGVCALCLSEKLRVLRGSTSGQIDNSASCTSSSISAYNYHSSSSSSSEEVSGGPSPLHYRYILSTIEAKNTLTLHRNALKKKVEEGDKQRGGVWYRMFLGSRNDNKGKGFVIFKTSKHDL